MFFSKKICIISFLALSSSSRSVDSVSVIWLEDRFSFLTSIASAISSLSPETVAFVRFIVSVMLFLCLSMMRCKDEVTILLLRTLS